LEGRVILQRFPYHLTSPEMHGDDVRRVQWRLNNNRFRKFLSPKARIGYFGPRTKDAVWSAKFWLGYPRRHLNGTYGEGLHAYLGGKQLPYTYRLRRKRRLAASVETQRVRAYRIAVSQLGVKEYPAGSNKVKYSLWYGRTGPWCAMFVTWCFVQAGNRRTFVRGSRYAYVPFLVADARAGRNGLSVTINPQRGDVVCYDWNGGVADHTGIFEGWTNKARGEFSAIEGNTAFFNDSNGGETERRFRHTYQVEDFVRVHSG
jgi:hypothetical protein